VTIEVELLRAQNVALRRAQKKQLEPKAAECQHLATQLQEEKPHLGRGQTQKRENKSGDRPSAGLSTLTNIRCSTNDLMAVVQKLKCVVEHQNHRMKQLHRQSKSILPSSRDRF